MTEIATGPGSGTTYRGLATLIDRLAADRRLLAAAAEAALGPGSPARKLPEAEVERHIAVMLDAIGASGGLVGVVYAVVFIRPDGAEDEDTPLGAIAAHLTGATVLVSHAAGSVLVTPNDSTFGASLSALSANGRASL